MAGKTFTVTIPTWTANLIPNVLGLLGLAGISVFVAFLTDWRWGGLLGSVFAVAVAVWDSLPDEAPGKPATQPKKAA